MTMASDLYTVAFEKAGVLTVRAIVFETDPETGFKFVADILECDTEDQSTVRWMAKTIAEKFGDDVVYRDEDVKEFFGRATNPVSRLIKVINGVAKGG